MTILLDHCTPRKYSKLLQTWGYKVEFLQAHIQADALDSEVIALAQKLDAVLLTVDMDFSNILSYPPDKYGGIIVIRYEAKDDDVATVTLQNVLKDMYRDKLRGSLIVISGEKYRIRQA